MHVLIISFIFLFLSNFNSTIYDFNSTIYASNSDEINKQMDQLDDAVLDIEFQMQRMKRKLANLRELINEQSIEFKGQSSFHITYNANVGWACSESDANLNNDPGHESGYSAKNRQARKSALSEAVSLCEAKTKQKCKGTGAYRYHAQGLTCNVETTAVPNPEFD